MPVVLVFTSFHAHVMAISSNTCGGHDFVHGLEHGGDGGDVVAAGVVDVALEGDLLPPGRHLLVDVVQGEHHGHGALEAVVVLRPEKYANLCVSRNNLSRQTASRLFGQSSGHNFILSSHLCLHADKETEGNL